MLREKYDPDNIFDDIPSLTVRMNPELDALDGVLDDDELFRMIHNDLAQRYPQTLTAGRYSTPVEVILRLLVVKHLYNWSYAQTELQVADSLTLRQFCRVYWHEIPDHTTLCRWANLIQPATLQVFNDRVLAIALRAKVTRGRKLRMDAMVVETNIHHPTDSSLLADSVRVLGRTLRRAKDVLSDTTDLPKQLFRNRTRSARHAAREIGQAARRGQRHTKTAYRRLVQAARATVRQVQQVVSALEQHAQDAGLQLIETFATFVPRAEQVIDQTVRRVFNGEHVPAAEKIVSIFEPHTQIIRRGKASKPTEFGHKVWLGEIDGGLISQYQILDGNPTDGAQWTPTLQRHREQFGHPPWLASADRGVHSTSNETDAADLGVTRTVLPKPGRKSDSRQAYERQSWFRRGRRFHVGIEGRISVVRRKHGLDRCRNKGQVGFERWVGWGLIANNLTVTGRAMAH